MHKVLWTVGLSNGETHYEEKGNFKTIAGELSPWQRLLVYMAEKGVTITSLSLYSDDGRRWNLPSAGKNPKFKIFSEVAQPVEYNMFRKMGADVTMDSRLHNQELFIVGEAVYEDGRRLQVWVDNSTGNSWTLTLDKNTSG